MAFIQRLGQLRSPVSTYANLPLSSNVLGDVRLSTDTGDAYTWMLEATSGLITDWKKVTTSSFNDLVDAPTNTGLAIDDAVAVVEGLAINIALLAFQTLTGYGASIARMFDGAVAQLKESDGLDDPSSIDDESSENYVQQYDHVMPNKGDLDIYTKFLVHGDGIQGSSAFVDLLRRAITSYGAVTDTVIKKFGTGSIKFDGVNDYVDIGLPDEITWDCVDFWFYSNASGEQPILGSSASTDPAPLDFDAGECITVKKNSANKIEVLLKKYTDIPEEPYRAWEDLTVTSASTVSSGAWHHIAIQVVDDYLEIWIDGVKDATSASAVAGYYEVANYAYNMYLGRIGSSYLNGYIDEIRFSNTTRYTTPFTPMTKAYNTATEPAPTPEIVDESDSEHEVTVEGGARMSGTNPLFGNASLYLDGIDSYLTLADSDDWKLCDGVVLEPYTSDSYTKLLLHLDNNVTDSEETPKTVTNNDVTFSDTVKKLGSYSGYFNGSSSYLSVPDSDDFAFGTGNFTIDFWVRFDTVLSDQTFFSQYQNSNNFFYMDYVASLSVCEFAIWVYNYTLRLRVPFAPSANTWYHIALVRTDSIDSINSWRWFINGTNQSITKVSGNWNATLPNIVGSFKIGVYNLSIEFLNGYLDEFRVSKGIARWTSNFTVSELSDYTVDLWVDPLSFTDLNAYIIGQADSWNLTLDGTINHYPKFTIVDGATMTAPISLVAEAWNHLAIVQKDGVIKLYVNGSLGASVAGSAIVNGTEDLTIGADLNGEHLFNGFIEEVRISDNARWAAAFSTPDEAYESDSNTTLLLPLNVQTVPNMVLQSVGYVSNYVPTSARVVIFEEDIDTMEPNVDLKIAVSRDGGTTFTDVIIAKDQEFGDGTLNLFTGSVNLQSQPNGELLVWKLTTQNNKDCRIRGVSLNWR